MTTVLPIPFGTYGATQPQYVKGRDGSIYTTSVGKLGNKTWRGRVWRIPPGGEPAEILLEVPGANQLFVIEGQLYCVWVDTTQGGSYNAKIKVTMIEGYLPLNAEVTTTTINIDAAQTASLQQKIAVAQNNAASATTQATNALTKVSGVEQSLGALKARVTKIEQSGVPASGGAGLSKQQIEDIVWAKVWDVIYILRMGMLNGSSDPNVQGFVNDVRTAVNKE